MDLLEQEMVTGSGISWATCKSKPEGISTEGIFCGRKESELHVTRWLQIL